MTQTYYPGREFAQEDMPEVRQHVRQIARLLNVGLRGQLNGTMSVTLTAGATTTTVTDARISLSTVPLFVPTTANAAAALATLYVEPEAGECTVHHANNAQTDRIFQVALIG
jgi:hypothetical protein